MKRVFQTDNQNVLTHGLDIPVEDDDSYCLPYGCVSVSPPTGAGAAALRWVSEVGRVDASFGEEGTGVWAVTVDLRRASLYLTSTGASYSIGHAFDGKSYDGLGELPFWLTDKPRPSGARCVRAGRAQLARLCDRGYGLHDDAGLSNRCRTAG
ncbi:hypothetical protein G6F68_017203 [Rhizopus microsporus]|nr:hypothetical protein G6F68_017203 [Rhizopus microsporus]